MSFSLHKYIRLYLYLYRFFTQRVLNLTRGNDNASPIHCPTVVLVRETLNCIAEPLTTTTIAPTSTILTSESTTAEVDTTSEERSQSSTSEQTSPELTTVAQSTVTSSPPPDVHCCCRCCFPSSPTCTFCDRDSLTDASECANEPPAIPTPVDRESPKFEAPATMKGSAFPERLALREDFVKKEQLTETLAALPTSEKVDLGFKTADMFVDCQYNKKQCSNK